MAFSFRSEIGVAFGAALLLVTPLAPALAQTGASANLAGPFTVATTPAQLSQAIVAAVQALGPRATNGQIRLAIRNVIKQALAAGMSIDQITQALALASQDPAISGSTAASAVLLGINSNTAAFLADVSTALANDQATTQGRRNPDDVQPGGNQDGNTVGGTGPGDTNTGNDYRPPNN